MGYRFPKCKHSIFAGSRLVVQGDVTKKMTYNIILCADVTQSDQVSTISFAVDSVWAFKILSKSDAYKT